MFSSAFPKFMHISFRKIFVAGFTYNKAHNRMKKSEVTDNFLRMVACIVMRYRSKISYTEILKI